MTVMAEAFKEAQFQQKFKTWIEKGKYTPEQENEAWEKFNEVPACRCSHQKGDHKKFGCAPHGAGFCRCKKYIPVKQDD